jgi:2-polyprenyl-3-methyl-5-hydroxy-6-metoxy-1,4-benzoquinol methylase
MKSQQIEELNVKFYDKLYKKKYPLIALLHSIVSYDQQSKSKRNYFYLQDSINSYQQRNRKIRYLDYGCGHGSLLLKMNSNMELYASDISINTLKNLSDITRLLKREINTITVDEFLVDNFERKFDIISCSHVLEHVENDKELLTVFNKNLASGGILLLNLPFNEVRLDPKHVHKYDIIKAKNMLNKSGFVIKEIIQSDRLTGWIMLSENSMSWASLKKIIFRVIRLLFGLIPLSILFLLDRMLPKKIPFQQLIIIAEKND